MTWGQRQATGTGTSTYVAPDQTTVQGSEQSARIVAFNLGECRGPLAYRAVTWYFPQHGETFDPARYIDICAGRYVGQ